MTEKLLPCPFCGSEDLETARDKESDWWWVNCNSCRAAGPVMTINTDDVRGWNRRTPVADTLKEGALQ